MEGTAVTVMEAITSALATALGLVSTILEAITSNPVMVVLFAGGTFLPLAVYVFRKIKNASIG